MNNKQNSGVLLGIIIAVVLIAFVVGIWLYGDKVKKDISDKLSNNTETTETAKEDNSAVIITLKT